MIIRVAPIKKLKLVESNDPIKLSCQSTAASFRGKEAKTTEFSADPIRSQPNRARAKEDFDLMFLRLTKSDSARNSNSSFKSIFRECLGEGKQGKSLCKS
jgi:hypothetical protein